MINHHSKGETISKLAVHLLLLQNYISSAKIYDEVRARCPKLGHTTLAISIVVGSDTEPLHFDADPVSASLNNSSDQAQASIEKKLNFLRSKKCDFPMILKF